MAMMLLSLLSVIIVLVMTFGRLDSETYRFTLFVDTSICMIFMINFFVGLVRARDKRFHSAPLD